MAPVRRYLRITKYSVLECRIYLDNPSLAQSWLLNPRNPILPQVIEAIRPFVIPKIREEKERERSKRKSAKKKTIKDVIVKDDFEVAMFLTETSTRHSLLAKHKHFHERGPGLMSSASTKLIAETNATPLDVDAYNTAPIRLLEEDSDEDGGGLQLRDIPSLADSSSENPHQPPKRQRDDVNAGGGGGGEGDDDGAGVGGLDPGAATDGDSDSDGYVPSPPPKRHRGPGRPSSTSAPLEGPENEGEQQQQQQGTDDKKKLAMDISYEGFAIYGRVLCLVVRKRVAKAHPGGQASMENWIASTQIPAGEEVG